MMQATIKNNQIERFRQRIEEGRCYFIINFKVVQTLYDYRIVTNDMKIIFYLTTILKEVKIEVTQIPLFHFHFADMNLISQRCNKNMYLTGNNISTSIITIPIFALFIIT